MVLHVSSNSWLRTCSTCTLPSEIKAAAIVSSNSIFILANSRYMYNYTLTNCKIRDEIHLLPHLYVFYIYRRSLMFIDSSKATEFIIQTKRPYSSFSELKTLSISNTVYFIRNPIYIVPNSSSTQKSTASREPRTHPNHAIS